MSRRLGYGLAEDLRRCTALLVAALTVLGYFAPGARADDVAAFYQGKDIKLLVSATVGGGYDIYARTLAKHLGEHIPGHPAVIPQNMPAAGGLAAANYTYNAAPRDGTVICLLQNTVPLEPFYANKQAQFDVTKLSWLGTPTTEVAVYLVWHTSKIRTLQDAQTFEMITGGVGAASTPVFYGRVFNQILGMKARLITGYPGQNELLLALENGEVEAMASPFWSSIKTSRPNWYSQGKIRFLFQYGAEPHPELKNVPFALDLLRNEADKALLTAASAPLALGRPFIAPPGVPVDRLAALRSAMTATFNDAQFRADCEKQRIECNDPKTGAQIETLIKQAYATPEDIRKRLIDIYQPGSGAESK